MDQQGDQKIFIVTENMYQRSQWTLGPFVMTENVTTVIWHIGCQWCYSMNFFKCVNCKEVLEIA